MNAAALGRVKRALLKELDVALQTHFHQKLSEVITDLRVHNVDFRGELETDRIISAIRTSHMLWMGEESSVAELRSALERLVSGSFGKCARCGRSMSAAYLEKHPTAQKCQACSESAQIVRSRRTPS